MKLFIVKLAGYPPHVVYGGLIAAPDEETARDIYPWTGEKIDWSDKNHWTRSFWAWKGREQVLVSLVGEACEGTPQGVLFACPSE